MICSKGYRARHVLNLVHVAFISVLDKTPDEFYKERDNYGLIPTLSGLGDIYVYLGVRRMTSPGPKSMMIRTTTGWETPTSQ